MKSRDQTPKLLMGFIHTACYEGSPLTGGLADKKVSYLMSRDFSVVFGLCRILMVVSA